MAIEDRYEYREQWIREHEEEILRAYIDSIRTIIDVPENFIDDYVDNNITNINNDIE